MQATRFDPFQREKEDINWKALDELYAMPGVPELWHGLAFTYGSDLFRTSFLV